MNVGVELPPADRAVLESWARSVVDADGFGATGPDRAAGCRRFGTGEIVDRVGVSKPTVIQWKRRYGEGGIHALDDRPRSGRPKTLDEIEIVLATLEPPPERLSVTHWSSRLLAKELKVSNVAVAKVWRKWGLQPWRTETFKFSTGAELDAKVRDIVGLYLDPPERPSSSASTRSRRSKPWTGPHRSCRCGRGWPRRRPMTMRHGTTTLFAALAH